MEAAAPVPKGKGCISTKSICWVYSTSIDVAGYHLSLSHPKQCVSDPSPFSQSSAEPPVGEPWSTLLGVPGGLRADQPWRSFGEQ